MSDDRLDDLKHTAAIVRDQTLCVNGKDLRALLDRINALQAIVDKLPKYEDTGDPIVPESTGYRIRIYRGHTPPVVKVHECDVEYVTEYGAHGTDDAYPSSETIPLCPIYFSKEAAEEAAEASRTTPTEDGAE